MNLPMPFLQLIIRVGIGACCVLASAAQALPAADGQRPPLYAAGNTQTPRLLATFVHPQAERSLAIVSNAGTASQTLKIGQPLGNGLRLHAIARDHIVLARGTQLSTLRLLGQAPGNRQPARTPVHPATTGTSTVSAEASTKGGAILRADSIDAVRAACSDATLTATLPAAQKAELSALGLCNPP